MRDSEKSLCKTTEAHKNYARQKTYHDTFKAVAPVSILAVDAECFFYGFLGFQGGVLHVGLHLLMQRRRALFHDSCHAASESSRYFCQIVAALYLPVIKSTTEDSGNEDDRVILAQLVATFSEGFYTDILCPATLRSVVH